jgi:predicted ATP-grasp superfamily ATP-dependent carboligase
VYLLKRFIANNEKEYPVTMAQMKNFIGIASNTTSNNEVINDILEVLELLGLVKIERRQIEENKTLLVVVEVNNVIREKC